MIKKIATNKHTIFIALIFFLSLVLYVWFIRSNYFNAFMSWSRQNAALYIGILLFLKVASLVYPPLPGGLFTMGSIPVIGWPAAYATDFMGSMIGSSMAYFLGKKYGLKLLNKVFDESTVQKIMSVKMKKHREIEGIFALRILTGTTVMEAVCYAAGLLKIKYRNFLIGSITSHLLIGIPLYYFTGNILGAKNIVFTVSMIVVSIILLYKLKGRYFE